MHRSPCTGAEMKSCVRPRDIEAMGLHLHRTTIRRNAHLSPPGHLDTQVLLPNFPTPRMPLLQRRMLRSRNQRPIPTSRARRMSTPAEPQAETHAFQAEVSELLQLMVHSVYSETDVFLRELISNASDACDRLRYEAIAKPELLADASALNIRITPDPDAGTLTISDTGIG